jgi:hypothetical protein
MRINFARASRAMLASATLLVSGCAGYETEVNSLSFHEGQAESNEQILLRNIILAAHDKAPTFVAASQVSSQGKASASLSAVFNRLTTVGHTLTPGISGERSQNVQIHDYGATKAARILYKEVDESILRDLLLQGWDYRLISTLLYRGAGVPEELDEAIVRKASAVCRTSNDPDERVLCSHLKGMLDECDEASSDAAPTGYVSYLNTARKKCDFENFQIFLSRAELAGAHFTFRPHREVTERKIKTVKGAKKEDKTVTVEETIENNVAFYLAFEDKHLRSIHNRQPLKIILRSPKEVIEFLGRLAALQIYSEPPYVATTPAFSNKGVEWIIPFRVVRSGELVGPSAVAVSVGSAGTFHVMETNPLSQAGDQSLRVMGFVIELQNRARQEAPIEGTGIAILQ